MVEVKASGPPHVLELWLGLSKVMLPVTCGRCEGLRTTSHRCVLELWLGLSKVMLPVTCGRGEGLRTTSCLRTVVGVKQGHAL